MIPIVERDVLHVLAEFPKDETKASKMFDAIERVAIKTDSELIAKTCSHLKATATKTISIPAIIHRARIVTNGRPRIKLADFVIATMLESMVNDQTILNFASKQGNILNPMCLSVPGNILPDSLDTVVIGRKTEVSKLAMLMSKGVRVIAVVGPRGIGKRSIIMGVAKAIATNKFPTLDKAIVDVNEFIKTSDRIAQEQAPGQMPQQVWIPPEITDSSRAYALIDHERFARQIRVDEAIPILIDRGANVIISTTIKFVNQLQRNPNLIHHIEILEIDELPKEQTIEAIVTSKEKIENVYFCSIPTGLCEYAYNLSSRFPMDLSQPGRTLSILELTAAVRRLGNISEVDKVLATNFETLVKQGKATEAKDLLAMSDKNVLARMKIDEVILEEKDVSTLMCQQLGVSTSVPQEAITADSVKQLSYLEDFVKKYVYGQDDAVKAICDSIRRKALRITTDNTPSSFLLVGGTGTGKTLTAKKIAELMFGTEDAIIRIDMSEYTERHTTSKLIGAPPGYVGYDDGGQLTDKVARRPHSVVLLDEIEKAHAEVHNIFLQVLSDGILTDSKGKKVSFKDCIIIMTSNLGTKKQVAKIGLASDGMKVTEESIAESIKTFFSPEFRNRIGKTIMYKPLTTVEVAKIISYEVNIVQKKVPFELLFDDAVFPFVQEQCMTKGDVSTYGGREVKRVLQDYLFTALTDKIMAGQVTPSKVRVTIKDNKLEVILT